MEETGMLVVFVRNVLRKEVCLIPMRFFSLQCSSKKKLQALIGQWQQKSVGEYHGSILTALENALPLFSGVCTGATSGGEGGGEEPTVFVPVMIQEIII